MKIVLKNLKEIEINQKVAKQLHEAIEFNTDLSKPVTIFKEGKEVGLIIDLREISFVV
jgi:PHD/YefM family antitoxin component YafN of YafNO toxin-antitoxin module